MKTGRTSAPWSYTLAFALQLRKKHGKPSVVTQKTGSQILSDEMKIVLSFV